MNSYYVNHEIARQHYASLQSEASLHRIARKGEEPELQRPSRLELLVRVVRAIVPHRRSLRPAIRSI